MIIKSILKGNPKKELKTVGKPHPEQPPKYRSKQVVASMNAAMCGLMPDGPLLSSDGTFQDCALSKQPLVQHNGVLCRFPLCEVRADWKLHKELMRLQVGWSCTNICHHCYATKDELLEIPCNAAVKTTQKPMMVT